MLGPGVDRRDEVDRGRGPRICAQTRLHPIPQVSGRPGLSRIGGQQRQQGVDRCDEVCGDELVPVDGSRDLGAQRDRRTARRQGHLPVLGVHRVESAADHEQQVGTADDRLHLRLVGGRFDREGIPRHDAAPGVRRDDGGAESLGQRTHGYLARMARLRNAAA